MNRRSFLAALPVSALLGLAFPDHAKAARRRVSEHPEPRPGIDGSEVVTEDQLREEGMSDEVIALYNGIRGIPEIADGLACYCGCMLMGSRSLLSCYSHGGMARGCPICQGEARIAIRRHGEGQSLEQIRRAIDARYS